MNKERLRKVRELLLLHKDQFNYSVEVHSGAENSDYPQAGELLSDECGTCGCVAGFTCALYAPNTLSFQSMSRAMDLLSLDWNQRRFLFLCTEFQDRRITNPEIVSKAPPAKELYKATVQDAIDRIDFLLSLPE